MLMLQAPWGATAQATGSSVEGRSNALGDCRISSNSTKLSPIVLKCSITPTENAYVDNLLPSKSWGGLPTLIVQNIPSVPVSKNYAFMKFDLSKTLPNFLIRSRAIPKNESIGLYVRLMNFFYNATVEVHAGTNNDWSENYITWNNMPQFDTENYVSTSIRKNGTWARWNITGLPEVSKSTGHNLTLVAISNETAWKNLVWFDSKEYSYVNSTTAPTLSLTYIEPYLTVQTPYSSLPVMIGNITTHTNTNGSVQGFVPWGKYQITVPDTIPLTNGTRAHFLRWDDDNATHASRVVLVGSNLTLHAEYGVQHLVSVYSQFGTTNGSGWYYDGTDADISLNPTSVPANGPLGWVGEQYVFDHWTGACSLNKPECSVLVDAPRTAQAVWRNDWTVTELAILIIVVSVTLILLLRRERAPREGITRNRNHRHSHRHRRKSK